VDNNKGLLIVVGLGAVGVLAYLAQQSTGERLSGVPQYQTEAQFDGLNTDLGDRVNPDTPLDMSLSTHFFVGGDCCPGQSLVKPRHRYPHVTGGNITAVINHGMDAMRLGSPDNSWRVQPPSEYTI
jgi:hypothetical protein